MLSLWVLVPLHSLSRQPNTRQRLTQASPVLLGHERPTPKPEPFPGWAGDLRRHRVPTNGCREP